MNGRGPQSNLVDASGWLEYFADGPDAAFFAQTLQDVEHLVVPTVTILDVFLHVYRRHGESDALQAAAAMEQGRVVNLDTTAALDGGRMAVEHDVAPAAGAVLAAARRHDARVWTLDESLKTVPGVRYRSPTGGGKSW